MRLRLIGYDLQPTYEYDEIVKMYLDQGLPREEAESLAEDLYLELRHMNAEDKQLWRYIRRNEKIGIDMSEDQ